jgi:uncharacterized protein YndB with AHSA1/START domain
VDIALSLDIATTPERLFDAITTAEGLASWYTPQARAEPHADALVEFGFGPAASIAFRVDEIVPNRRVVWSGVQVPPDWQSTRIAFDLAPAGDLVTVRFSQIGFPSGYADFGFFSYLWAQYMLSLKLLLETGTASHSGRPGRITATLLPSSDTILSS